MSRNSPPSVAIPSTFTLITAPPPPPPPPPLHPPSSLPNSPQAIPPLHSRAPIPYHAAKQPPFPILSLLSVFRGGKTTTKKKKPQQQQNASKWEERHPMDAADSTNLLLHSGSTEQLQEIRETAAEILPAKKKELRFAAKIAAAMDADGFVGVKECLGAEEERKRCASVKESQLYSTRSSAITTQRRHRPSRHRARRRCKLVRRIRKTPVLIGCILRRLKESIAMLLKGFEVKNKAIK